MSRYTPRGPPMSRNMQGNYPPNPQFFRGFHPQPPGQNPQQRSPQPQGAGRVVGVPHGFHPGQAPSQQMQGGQHMQMQGQQPQGNFHQTPHPQMHPQSNQQQQGDGLGLGALHGRQAAKIPMANDYISEFEKLKAENERLLNEKGKNTNGPVNQMNNNFPYPPPTQPLPDTGSNEINFVQPPMHSQAQTQTQPQGQQTQQSPTNSSTPTQDTESTPIGSMPTYVPPPVPQPTSQPVVVPEPKIVTVNVPVETQKEVHFVMLDSRDRDPDCIESNDFYIRFLKPYTNVISIELVKATLPGPAFASGDLYYMLDIKELPGSLNPTNKNLQDANFMLQVAPLSDEISETFACFGEVNFKQPLDRLEKVTLRYVNYAGEVINFEKGESFTLLKITCSTK